MVFGFPTRLPPDGTGLTLDGVAGAASRGATAVAGVETLRRDVAHACRVLATEGYTDLTLGHVSARVPGREAILVKRKGLTLEEVRPEDVVMVDLHGATSRTATRTCTSRPRSTRRCTARVPTWGRWCTGTRPTRPRSPRRRPRSRC